MADKKKKKDMKKFISRRRAGRGTKSPQYTRGYPQAMGDIVEHTYGEGKNFTTSDGSINEIASLAYADKGNSTALYYHTGNLKVTALNRGNIVGTNADASDVATVAGKSRATIPLTHGG
tara:strand:+ start:1012 stop:1368 length:357 start_codon:yes stop_codon:yes gene_type:complete